MTNLYAFTYEILVIQINFDCKEFFKIFLISMLFVLLQILVAPVLNFGVRERNVYLPNMEDDDNVVWKRGTDGTFLKGGKWINGTRVKYFSFFSRLERF